MCQLISGQLDMDRADYLKRDSFFSQLDDYDIVAAMKQWQFHEDFVLSKLCEMILNRNLLKIKLKNKKIKARSLKKHIDSMMEKYAISEEEAWNRLLMYKVR